MASQVIMPKLSPTMEEGQVSRWLKKEGDKVSMGEPLAEIDTDKATMEMQALSEGVLRKILVNEGESAPLGQPIAIIGEPDEDISSLLTAGNGKASQASAAPSEPSGKAVETAPAAESPEASDAGKGSETSSPAKAGEGQPARGDGRQLISPIAARMAADSGI